MRLHIAIFGRRNVGKSSVLNSLVGQSVSIVSDQAGTTTDPVEKAMEMLPLGPVLFIDTAGIDDTGDLGRLRIRKTMSVFERADLALLIVEGRGWGSYEEELYGELKQRAVPAVIVINKVDEVTPEPDVMKILRSKGEEPVLISALTGQGIDELRERIIKAAPEEAVNLRSIIGDLLPSGELVVLVVPIDLEAPKGRLILPQVQTIRDALDNDACVMVVKEHELSSALNRLKTRPALVVTDSQAFLKVASDTPAEVPMTSFSILFARFKGDLTEMVRGATTIDRLQPGDKVLICEACAHHPIGDDIGRAKLPRWLTQYVGGKLHFDHFQGQDFPENIHDYKLIIHCGACMWNRRAMLSRIVRARQYGVPITNYGLAIAYSLGIFERALQPFPQALEVYREERNIRLH